MVEKPGEFCDIVIKEEYNNMRTNFKEIKEDVLGFNYEMLETVKKMWLF